jgi:hypothetical protein
VGLALTPQALNDTTSVLGTGILGQILQVGPLGPPVRARSLACTLACVLRCGLREATRGCARLR